MGCKNDGGGGRLKLAGRAVGRGLVGGRFIGLAVMDRGRGLQRGDVNMGLDDQALQQKCQDGEPSHHPRGAAGTGQGKAADHRENSRQRVHRSASRYLHANTLIFRQSSGQTAGGGDS